MSSFRLPRSVGFVRWFVFPGSVSRVDDLESRKISGNTPEGFRLSQKAPHPLLELASTIDFRSADPRKVESFLESEYPKIRIAAQYALGWLDEVAVAEALFSAYGPTVSVLDSERESSPRSLLDCLLLRGLLSDVNQLLGTPPPPRGDFYSSTPVLAKFIWQIAVSHGLAEPSDTVTKAEKSYKEWQKRPRKVGVMGSTVFDDLAKKLRDAKDPSYYYVLTMMDEATMSYPNGIFLDRMFHILKKHNPDEIFNIWPSAYEMLWDAGYRW